jgi:diguanylate cyclase (GGDEF)-like protein
MAPTDALSMFFGSALIIILIFAEFYREYVNRHSSKHIQKKSFCSILIVSFVFLAVDIMFSMIGGIPAFLSLTIDFLSAVLVLCLLILFRKMYRKIVMVIIFALAALYIASLLTDLVTGSTKLIWPCISALLLYTYFVIVQHETKLDHLTSLGNRNSFHEFIDELARHKTESSWVVVMIDIDDTKVINNTYGHLEGDNALRILGEIIKNCIRKTDFASRYGGDEFILATKVEDGIEGLLKKIKAELVSYNEKSGKPYKINISYGFDTYSAGKQIEEFLNHLDELTKKHKMSLRRGDDKIEGQS